MGLGLFARKRRELPAVINTIAVLETAAIGDTTLLSAILLDLRDAYPSARVVLLAGQSNVAVARLLAGPDEVVMLPIKDVLSTCRMVRGRHFDLFLDFGPWPRINAVIAHFADADFKIGFNTPGQYRHYVYDRTVRHCNAQHELENFRDMLRAIDVPSIHAPGFPSSVGQDDIAGRYRLESPYVVFHLWPGGYRAYLKEWPVERWLQLGSAMSEMGFHIALTGAPAEHVRNEAVKARAASALDEQKWVNCAGATLDETISILRRGALTVSVNTGVMHLAAVVGAPVVGLHGPTSARRWGPVGPLAVAISAPGSGCAYLDLGFEYPPNCECMGRVTVEQVLAECRSILRRHTAANV